MVSDFWLYTVYWSTFAAFLTGCYLVYLLVRYLRECIREMGAIRQIVFPFRLDASLVSAKAVKFAKRMRIAATVLLSLIIFLSAFWAVEISRMP